MPTFGGSRGSRVRTSPLSVSWMRTWRIGRERLRGGRDGARDRQGLRDGWAPRGPAELALQLRRQPEQALLAERGRNELRADRKAVARGGRRDRDGRLARHVPDAGEGVDRRHPQQGPQRAEPLPPGR